MTNNREAKNKDSKKNNAVMNRIAKEFEVELDDRAGVERANAQAEKRRADELQRQLEQVKQEKSHVERKNMEMLGGSQTSVFMEQCKFVFQHLDVDKDGLVSFQEFLSFTALAQCTPEVAKSAFQKYSHFRPGYLTPQEFFAFAQRRVPLIQSTAKVISQNLLTRR